MNKIMELVKIIKECQSIVFFGGAGVSTESGIPDFRSVDGLYNQKYKYPPEEILSHTFFLNNPKEFYRFYKDKMIVKGVKCNFAHIFLKKLEDMGKLKAIVTQNIDGLHSEAGNKIVYELHGSIKRNHCMKCHRFYDEDYIINSVDIPHCSCGGIIKPDVVLYEEPLDEKVMLNSINAIENADCLIVGGTSLQVYPAAGLVRYFNGKYLVLINKDSTSLDTYANLVINDKIGKVFMEADKYLKCEIK